MKLSEALRLGEFALPPSHEAWFVAHMVSGRICGACALGRAVWAAGYRPARKALKERVALSVENNGAVPYRGEEHDAICWFVSTHWPWTMAYALRFVRHPMKHYNYVAAYISQMYEANRLSMAEIAARIETLESIYDTDPVTIDVTPIVAGTPQPLEVR